MTYHADAVANTEIFGPGRTQLLSSNCQRVFLLIGLIHRTLYGLDGPGFEFRQGPIQLTHQWVSRSISMGVK